MSINLDNLKLPASALTRDGRRAIVMRKVNYINYPYLVAILDDDDDVEVYSYYVSAYGAFNDYASSPSDVVAVSDDAINFPEPPKPRLTPGRYKTSDGKLVVIVADIGDNTQLQPLVGYFEKYPDIPEFWNADGTYCSATGCDLDLVEKLDD